MIKSFNFLIAIVAIAITSIVPTVGHIWYAVPITETASVTKIAIGAIGFCYMLFKFKE